MDLGLYSTSLAVKDLAASREFYEKLGFRVRAGDEEHYELAIPRASLPGSP